MNKRTLSMDSRLKRDFTQAKKWLDEMMEVIPDFSPDTDFIDYLDSEGNQRFDNETAQILNEKLSQTAELFSYHIAAPGDDIYSYVLDFYNEKGNVHTQN